MSGSERKSKKEEDVLEWLDSIPDNALIRVYQGRSYLASFEAAFVKEGDIPLEEILLEKLGAGRYRLVPVIDGKINNDKSITVSVGKPDLSFMKPSKSELELIKDYIAELEKKIEEKQRPQIDIAQVVQAAVSAITSLAQLTKGDTEVIVKFIEQLSKMDGTRELLAPVIERMFDPSQGIQQLKHVVELVKEMREIYPAPPQLEGEGEAQSKDGDALSNLVSDVFKMVMNKSQNAGKLEPPSPPPVASALHGAEGGDGSPSAPPAQRAGVINAFVSRIREIIRQGEPAEEVAELILKGLDAAAMFAPDHPFLRSFVRDPERTFDQLASLIPEFHEDDNARKFRDDVKRLILERIKGWSDERAQLTE